MKKLLQVILYPALAIAVLLFAYASLAQGVGKPLVVVRFNQSRVYYEQPLYQAVAKAVAVKPEVMFDIISYAPSTGNAASDAQWQQLASQHAQQLVASMQSMGVPLSRMSVSGQRQAGLNYDEVQVFVR